jgi:hypothetical protein
MDPVGVRIQDLDRNDQVLALARIAEGRVASRTFAAGDIDNLFDETALPRPPKVDNQLRALKKNGDLTQIKVPRGQPSWRVTPQGRKRSRELAPDIDLAALIAETAAYPLGVLAETPHPVIPPSLAPPALLNPVRAFLEEHDFGRNVFGMTRFPSEGEEGELDPIRPALEAARDVCANHGLEFHLASDRKIVDDLWPNVEAHIWASQHAIAFYEDRTGRGLNYNMNIEVGSCMVLGRRIAVLKDKPVEKLPTDLVGRIFTEVDLDDVKTVEKALEKWIVDDLRLDT